MLNPCRLRHKALSWEFDTIIFSVFLSSSFAFPHRWVYSISFFSLWGLLVRDGYHFKLYSSIWILPLVSVWQLRCSWTQIWVYFTWLGYHLVLGGCIVRVVGLWNTCATYIQAPTLSKLWVLPLIWVLTELSQASICEITHGRSNGFMFMHPNKRFQESANVCFSDGLCGKTTICIWCYWQRMK